MSRIDSKIRVFYSYSHKDEKYREQLEEHLTILKRSGILDDWSDRKILPGKNWRAEIDRNLEQADLILVLVSSSFIASDYCFDKELGFAMARHESGKARVIPIFIRPAEWRDAPFAGIQGLPKDALPISQWDNEDVAWQNVAAGLRHILGEIQEQKVRPYVIEEMKTLKEALAEEVERIDSLYSGERPAEINGVSTGLIDVDRMINGLGGGDLIVLASRPSMGKTNLSLKIAGAVAEQDLAVLIFSIKSPARDISRRMLTSRGQINYSSYGLARLQDEDWPNLTAAISALVDKPLFIDDSPSLNLSDLRTKSLREKKRLGEIALIVIDSADYLACENEAVPIGRFLKSLAREVDAPILVTSNVSRAVETRPNKRPVPNDINKNSDLSDEADIIAFLYIDSHYNPDSTDCGTAELIIAKNPHGPIGTVRLTHHSKHGAFHNFGGF